MARYNKSVCKKLYDKYMNYCYASLNAISEFRNKVGTSNVRKQIIKQNNPIPPYSMLDEDQDISLPLDAVVKGMFERAFNEDFSQVKIHLGSYSDEITRSSNALAITKGTNIYFKSGKYSIDTEEGLKLLAHELQHVVQYLNDKKLSHIEDIEEAELESEKIEEMMDVVNIHNIKDSLLQTFGYIQELNETDIDSYTFKENAIQDNNVNNVNKFLKKEDEVLYKMKLNHDKNIYLTKEQKQKIINEVKIKLSDHFSAIKNIMPENDYNEYLLKFLNLTNKY